MEPFLMSPFIHVGYRLIFHVLINININITSINTLMTKVSEARASFAQLAAISKVRSIKPKTRFQEHERAKKK